MNKTGSIFTLLLVLLASFAVFAFETNSYPLIGVDEPRYAETAREMIARHDLVTPFCNYQPRYDKPVFYYWLEALSMTSFGFNEFAARLPSIIAGLGMVVLAYLLGSVQGYGLISAVIMATSLEICVASRLAITDITLCFFISATITFFFLGYVNQDSYRRKFAFNRKTTSNWFVSMFVTAAFGMLTKGPVAIVLPLAVIIPFLIYKKEFVRCLQDAKQEMIAGFIGFLLISLPWYISVHIATNGEFTNEFFFRHNLERYTGVVSNHHGPFWFYLPIILVGFFPWVSVLFPALKATLSEAPNIQLSSRLNSNNLSKFCLWWALVVLLFFSVAGTKLPTYILPIYLPLSIITATWWSNNFGFERTQPWRNLSGLIGMGVTLVIVFIGIILATGTFKSKLLELSPDGFTLAFLIIGFILAAGFCIAMTAILREAEVAFITLAITAIAVYLVAASMLIKPYAIYMDDGLKKFATSEQGAIYTLESPLTNLFFYSKHDVPALKFPELRDKLNNGEELTLIIKNRQDQALKTKLANNNGEGLLTLSKTGKRFKIYKSRELLSVSNP